VRHRKRDTEQASSIFQNIVPGKKWKVFLPRRVIWQKWEEIAGEALSRNAWPWYFRDMDCLVIAVPDNIWMQQLSYQKDVILERINQHLPTGSRLGNLRFQLGDIERIRKIAFPRIRGEKAEDGFIRDASEAPDSRAFQLLESLEDEDIKEAFRSLLGKAG